MSTRLNPAAGFGDSICNAELRSSEQCLVSLDQVRDWILSFHEACETAFFHVGDPIQRGNSAAKVLILNTLLENLPVFWQSLPRNLTVKKSILEFLRERVVSFGARRNSFGARCCDPLEQNRRECSNMWERADAKIRFAEEIISFLENLSGSAGTQPKNGERPDGAGEKKLPARPAALLLTDLFKQLPPDLLKSVLLAVVRTAHEANPSLGPVFRDADAQVP